MSNQDVSTPAELIRAVESRFGPLTIDLAANHANHKAYRWLGPGGIAEDALAVDWRRQVIGCEGSERILYDRSSCAWLNNPYKNTAEWVKKAHGTVNDPIAGHGWKILQLIPASVCANYWIDYIDPCAYQIKLTPRPFADEVRDCVLVAWTPEQYVGIETWNWQEQG